MAVLKVISSSSVDFFRMSTLFDGVGQESIRYSSETAIALETSDLNRLVLNGTNLNYDVTQENSWVGGIVTSITLWDRFSEKKIAEITGLNIDLSDLGPRFGIPLYGVGGLVSYLFSGNDTFIGSVKGESFYSSDGNDSIAAGGGDDAITAGSGNDTVDGGAGYDLLSYWNYEVVGGNDTTPGAVIDLRLASVVDPWGGTDRVISIEAVEGTHYADILTGDNGNNSFYGLAGNDHLIGLFGNDFFVGGEGADTIEGGGGFDTVSYADYAGSGSIDVDLVAGTVKDAWGTIDTISGIESVCGTGNADKFLGSDADETFQGMGGGDTIDGGGGLDTVSYSADMSLGGLSGVSVDLEAGTARDGFGADDTLIGIEGAYGTAFADTLYGSGLANTLSGGDGNDKLDGRSGNDVLNGGSGNDSLVAGTGNDILVAGAGDDWLYGGAGRDTLAGGIGRDRFVFDTKAAWSNLDTIKDFNKRYDTCWLDNAAFTKLKLGWLSASAFHVGTKAHDSSDRVIYNEGTGALYYDPDGTGRAAQVKFALVGPHKGLTHSDFFIY